MNACQQCGACCAFFRVSFYWGEAAELGLPGEAFEQLTPHLACLTGTNQIPPRCHALQGVVGKAVTCVRYEARPSPCREVQAGDEKCNRARARHGLPPLTAEQG
jgi:Fe-S-cluster containining protein